MKKTSSSSLKTALKFSLFLAIVLTLCSCSINDGIAAKSVVNQTISFYMEEIGGQFDKSIAHKDLVFHFDNTGTYKVTVDGNFFQAGDYSYTVDQDVGKLLVTYSSSNNLYQYQFDMVYKTASTGTWKGTYSTNPNLTRAGSGTFQIIP